MSYQMINDQTSNIDCSTQTGVDAQACQSLQHAVAAHNIDLSTPSGQYTAYFYHQAVFNTLQRQELSSGLSN